MNHVGKIVQKKKSGWKKVIKHDHLARMTTKKITERLRSLKDVFILSSELVSWDRQLCWDTEQCQSEYWVCCDVTSVQQSVLALLKQS